MFGLPAECLGPLVLVVVLVFGSRVCICCSLTAFLLWASCEAAKGNVVKSSLHNKTWRYLVLFVGRISFKHYRNTQKGGLICFRSCFLQFRRVSASSVEVSLVMWRKLRPDKNSDADGPADTNTRPQWTNSACSYVQVEATLAH